MDGDVNHGNSGGALLNKNGAVVGVIYGRMENNSASSTQKDDIYGLGTAVPSKDLMEFFRDCNVDYTLVKAGESVW